jgi:hypothetical protein
MAFQEIDVMVGVPKEPRHLPVLAKVGDVFVRVLVGPKVFVETDGAEERVVGEELGFC